MMAMLQNVMADRFKLVVRRETRDMPAYALMLQRSDGRLGPQLRPSSGECEAMAAARRGGPPPPAPPNVPFCGTRTGRGSVQTYGVSLVDFARNLAPMTGRFVVDRSGLTGSYDVDLKWTPDGSAPGADATASALTDGTSLFAAIREQLGLRLEPVRAPVEVIVMDSVERPTED